MFTHQTHPDPSQLYPSRVPQNLSPWLGKLGGQRLGVNLEVVVPERLSDLTDCSGPDGRYELRSGVKGGHKRKVSWPPIVWLHLPPTRTGFNVVWLQRLEFQTRQMSQHWNASLFTCDVIHWTLSYHYLQLQTAYQMLACSYPVNARKIILKCLSHCIPTICSTEMVFGSFESYKMNFFPKLSDAQ